MGAELFVLCAVCGAGGYDVSGNLLCDEQQDGFAGWYGRGGWTGLQAQKPACCCAGRGPGGTGGGMFMNGMRKAQSEDARFVYERMCDLEERVFDWQVFEPLYLEQLKDETMDSLIFEVDGKRAGYAAVRYGTYLHHCVRTAELIELNVDETRRDQGIGQAFFEEIVRLAKEKGCAELALATNQKRKRAHRFYEKNGMKATHFTYTKNI